MTTVNFIDELIMRNADAESPESQDETRDSFNPQICKNKQDKIAKVLDEDMRRRDTILRKMPK